MLIFKIVLSATVLLFAWLAIGWLLEFLYSYFGVNQKHDVSNRNRNDVFVSSMFWPFVLLYHLYKSTEGFFNFILDIPLKYDKKP